MGSAACTSGLAPLSRGGALCIPPDEDAIPDVDEGLDAAEVGAALPSEFGLADIRPRAVHPPGSSPDSSSVRKVFQNPSSEIRRSITYFRPGRASKHSESAGDVRMTL